jgi:hypothetical protein
MRQVTIIYCNAIKRIMAKDVSSKGEVSRQSVVAEQFLRVAPDMRATRFALALNRHIYE